MSKRPRERRYWWGL